MDRIGQVLKYVTKSQVGIEVAPYHSPVASRRDGYRSISLDVFDAEELRRRAAEDPNIPDADVDRIEDVDLQGSAVDIADLVSAEFGDKRFDYIVSSHNFEHLPDPVRFLQGCQQVLAPGGMLSMAVPDRRYCFDFFRPVTDLSEWLDAFHEKRQRPTAGQIFRGQAMCSNLDGVGAWGPWQTAVPTPEENLESAYQRWRSSMRDSAAGAATGQAADPEYVDAHCSAFTPASLELMLADLRFLGLIQLETLEITPPSGCEFYVHLRNADRVEPAADPAGYYRERAGIMQRAAVEAGYHPPARIRAVSAGLRSALAIGRQLRTRTAALRR